MEHPSDPRNIRRDQKCVGAAERTIPHRTRQGTKLRDMLMSDKPNLSYADFHHEITRNSDYAIPKYVGSQKSQVFETTTLKEEELVRYMSNLPSYLEKGKNFPDKALSVGVLDWKRLEKWQYSQKQMPPKHNGYSPSSSNTSVFSTDSPSTHSSRGQSCSPARQRMQRLSVQSPLEASPKEGHVQDAKFSSGRGHSCSPASQKLKNPVVQSHPNEMHAGGGKSHGIDVFKVNPEKFQDTTVGTVNHLSRQPRVLKALHRSERKGSISEMGQLPTFDKYEAAAPWKGKGKIQGSESTKQSPKLQENKLEATDRDYFRRQRSGVPTMPLDQSQHSCSGAAASDFKANAQLSAEPARKIIPGINNCEDTLSSRIDSNKHSEAAGPSSQNPECILNSSRASHISVRSTKMFHSPSRTRGAQVVRGPSPASQMLSFPARMLSSPSRSRNTEEKQVGTAIRSASAAKPCEELDVRKSCESVPKARNPSPIRRLSFAMGKMIKNASSRDNSPLRRSSSKDCIAKSGSEGATAVSSIDNPCNDKSSTNNNRGRSSPLRRLLDPLLKPRASSSSEPSKKHSSPIAGTVKSCNNQSDIQRGHSAKVKSRSASGSTMNASASCHNSNNRSPSLQALLQVSFRNGFPLFTFAIDNESDILAATVRKSFVPGKGHHSWTYTFFNVREIKRKSGIWLNHGGKGDGHGYLPNVVAQMKVSDIQGSFPKHENADDYITREFDLFAVDVGHGDQYAPDFHPTNELAAIVIKLPKLTSANTSKEGQSTFNWLDSSQACCREGLEEKSSDDDSQQSLLSLGSLNLITTVILPGGVHTIPSKGEISTLAHRWRSGGSCDCGGWDLGCQLRVYSNRSEYDGKLASSQVCSNEDKFQLFPQVGQDNQVMLSLAPFKERIYSVEFNSSLSLLQAFAICISFIDCKRPAELSELSNVVEKKANEGYVFEVPIRMKTSSHQGEAPGRYVSYPPHSPVGRV